MVQLSVVPDNLGFDLSRFVEGLPEFRSVTISNLRSESYKADRVGHVFGWVDVV